MFYLGSSVRNRILPWTFIVKSLKVSTQIHKCIFAIEMKQDKLSGEIVTLS